MGAFLSQPLVEKENERGVVQGLAFAAAAMQGWRNEMEVRIIFSSIPTSL